MKRSEAGFSLVELTVAMLITLVISGAIYALVGSGSNMFRREPALTDKQQAIRIAMDVIAREGEDATGFINGFNGVGPTGPNGATDYLQMMVPDPTCPDTPVTQHSNSVNMDVNSAGGYPSCYYDDQPVFVYFDDGTVMPAFLHNNHAHETSANFPRGQPNGSGDANNWNTAMWDYAGTGPSPVKLGRGLMIQYRLANDVDGVLSLWRSGSGGLDPADPGNSVNPPAGDWQLVARGVDDLQVRYLTQFSYAAGLNDDDPNSWPNTITGSGNRGKLVRELQVTLGSRTVGQANLQGQTTPPSPGAGPTAVRGTLRTVITARSILSELAQASPSPGTLYK